MTPNTTKIRPAEWYKPVDDGVTHINVYSKGATELGRKLSNFAHTPFKHPDHGKFESVEGFWYWYKSGCQYDVLRNAWGYEAKRLGKDIASVHKDDFEEVVREAIFCKIIQNPEVAVLLANCDLPLVHYYYYGERDQAPKVIPIKQYDWMLDEMDIIRTMLKESKQPEDADVRPDNCICTTSDEFDQCRYSCLRGVPINDELRKVVRSIVTQSGYPADGEVATAVSELMENAFLIPDDKIQEALMEARRGISELRKKYTDNVPEDDSPIHEYQDIEVQLDANADAATSRNCGYLPVIDPPPDGEYEGEDEPDTAATESDLTHQSIDYIERHSMKRQGTLSNPHGVCEDDLCRYREDWEYPEGYSRENDGLGLLEDGEMVEVVELDSDIDEYAVAVVKTSQGLINVNVCHLIPIGHVDGIETDGDSEEVGY